VTTLDPAVSGLRTHDIHVGLHDVDRNSALFAAELEATQLAGMAAAVAAWIKGHDVIDDAPALKIVAADQLDVNAFAFDAVIGLLTELDFVRNVTREGGRVKSFYETVPEDYSRMYGQVGAAWEARQPTEIESSLIRVVDQLSSGPLPVSRLDVDADALETVLAVGQEAEAVQITQVGEQPIAYSPFFAYEHPGAMKEVLDGLQIERVSAAFGSVRSFQGVPLSISPHGQALNALVAAGLMAGPSLERPDHSRELFAVAPYGLGPDVLTHKRPLFEKALAVLAAVRMGQHFGGVTNLHSPAAFLHALMQPDRVVAWHSSSDRQYGVLHSLGIVRFVSSGGRVGIQLIDTSDNSAAIRLAIDLLGPGEAAATKGTASLLERTLVTPGNYRPQIQGIRPARRRVQFPAEELVAIVEAAMGRRVE
jgi:hypothetical protein